MVDAKNNLPKIVRLWITRLTGFRALLKMGAWVRFTHRLHPPLIVSASTYMLKPDDKFILMCRQAMADDKWFKSGVKKRSADVWVKDRDKLEAPNKNMSDLKNNC